MFLSDAARMQQYYRAWFQQDTSPVARWFLLNAAFGRMNGLPPEPRINTPAWSAWNQARRWPLLSFLEMNCPYHGCVFLPFLWHRDLPWFDRPENPEFRFAARPNTLGHAAPPASDDPRPVRRRRV